jgi:hypothetical protein
METGGSKGMTRMTEPGESENKEARLSELVGHLREAAQDRTPPSDVIGFREATSDLGRAVRAVTEVRRREKLSRRER